MFTTSISTRILKLSGILNRFKVGTINVKSFTYAGVGRTTQIATSAYTRNFSYDFESRVTQITGLSTTNTFTYNGFDTRTKKVDAAGTSNFQRIGAGVTAAVVADGSAAYTPGISERRSSTTKYMHAGLKNADMQTNSSQTSNGTRRYDAFGLVVGGVGSYGGPFGYAGKVWLSIVRRRRSDAPGPPLLRPFDGKILDAGSYQGWTELVWVLQG